MSGFTSGIAVIIFVGQIDNFLGVKTPGAESAALKLLHYFTVSFTPHLPTLLVGAIVIVIMLPVAARQPVDARIVGRYHCGNSYRCLGRLAGTDYRGNPAHHFA
ncbi:MAG: SulP family inorganic anion transporter [Caldilineaceae bacterium]